MEAWRSPEHTADTFCLNDSRVYSSPPQMNTHLCLVWHHRVLVLGASPRQNARSCAIWGCFCFCNSTYQGQVYPARRAHCVTGSQYFLVFFFPNVALVLPSNHTRNSSSALVLFYVRVGSSRALRLRCISTPGHGGAHSQSSLCT